MKIVVLDGRTLNKGDLSWDGLQALGECHIYENTQEDEVTERCQGAEIVLTNKVRILKKEMEALPALKYIGVLATGYNVVDIEEAKKRGIIVTNIPAYSTDSVVQMVFAHILNIANQVEHYTQEIRKGKWTQNPDFCYWNTKLFELAGKKLGIVGLGHIGMSVAHVAHAFGMQVLALTSKSKDQLEDYITPVDKETLFRESDILTLHCPLTADTHHFVNKEMLSLMKPSAILINTGRGPLIDEQAVAEALNNRSLFAAGIDVMSSEPPLADNPLLTATQCYITPHIAWATYEARVRLMQISIQNIRSFQEGHIINNVAI